MHYDPMVSENKLGKWLIFISKWSTAWHHNVIDPSLNNQLQSFDNPVAEKKTAPIRDTCLIHKLSR